MSLLKSHVLPIYLFNVLYRSVMIIARTTTTTEQISSCICKVSRVNKPSSHVFLVKSTYVDIFSCKVRTEDTFG